LMMSAVQLTPAQICEYYQKLLTESLPAEKSMPNVDSLLRKFPGKEHVVYTQICKKCGVEPKPRASPQDILNYITSPVTVAPKEGSVSHWLTTKGFAKYAAIPWFTDMKWATFLTITGEQLQELGVGKSDGRGLLALIALEASKRKQRTQVESSAPVMQSDFIVGENCFTKVCSEGFEAKGSNESGDKWLNARITHVNDDNTFDIFVYDSEAHGVPSEAVDVPRNMLRKSTEQVQVAVPEPKTKPQEKPRFKQGDRIKVFGLRSHVNYNGMFGKILLHIPSEKRYQVQLDTFDIIAIRQRNVAPADVNIQEIIREGYEEALKSAKAKMEKNNVDVPSVKLSNLLLKLMETNPNAEPVKVGEFAAGYLSAMASMKKENLEQLSG